MICETSNVDNILEEFHRQRTENSVTGSGDPLEDVMNDVRSTEAEQLAGFIRQV